MITNDLEADVEEERVVLLDAERRPAGTAPKLLVHGPDTPLHLAFSCYVFDRSGRLLLTRRALGKRTWPGVWTNSFCGHPGPDEQMPAAIRRRARDELGLDLDELHLVLPDFHYRAVDVSGVVENEFCPVWVGRASAAPQPAPEEVCDWHWVSWRELLEAGAGLRFMLSPWAQLQLPQLAALIPDGRP
jgi:isopentenyl-diphosphate delta-isomerase